jgi:hypothetical protein
MSARLQPDISEDELDVLVSIAIQRAELLEDQRLPSARNAWAEVMQYEVLLSELTDAGDLPGGVARVGAIAAALSAGNRNAAEQLRAKFLADAALPSERRKAIDRAFAEDRTEKDRRYPSLARRRTWLSDLTAWRGSVASQPRVFPSYG